MPDTTSPDTRPLIAILNTSIDTVELLESVFQEEGFATVADYVVEYRQRLKDIGTFLRHHQPKAVVYDIAIPYVANWRFFQEQVLGLQLLPASSFVLTTTNKTVLEVLVGPTGAHELVGKPFDLDEIVQAVRRAIEERRA